MARSRPGRPRPPRACATAGCSRTPAAGYAQCQPCLTGAAARAVPPPTYVTCARTGCSNPATGRPPHPAYCASHTPGNVCGNPGCYEITTSAGEAQCDVCLRREMAEAVTGPGPADPAGPPGAPGEEGRPLAAALAAVCREYGCLDARDGESLFCRAHAVDRLRYERFAQTLVDQAWRGRPETAEARVGRLAGLLRAEPDGVRRGVLEALRAGGSYLYRSLIGRIPLTDTYSTRALLGADEVDAVLTDPGRTASPDALWLEAERFAYRLASVPPPVRVRELSHLRRANPALGDAVRLRLEDLGVVPAAGGERGPASRQVVVSYVQGRVHQLAAHSSLGPHRQDVLVGRSTPERHAQLARTVAATVREELDADTYAWVADEVDRHFPHLARVVRAELFPDDPRARVIRWVAREMPARRPRVGEVTTGTRDGLLQEWGRRMRAAIREDLTPDLWRAAADEVAVQSPALGALVAEDVYPSDPPAAPAPPPAAVQLEQILRVVREQGWDVNQGDGYYEVLATHLAAVPAGRVPELRAAIRELNPALADRVDAFFDTGPGGGPPRLYTAEDEDRIQGLAREVLSAGVFDLEYEDGLTADERTAVHDEAVARRLAEAMLSVPSADQDGVLTRVLAGCVRRLQGRLQSYWMLLRPGTLDLNGWVDAELRNTSHWSPQGSAFRARDYHLSGLPPAVRDYVRPRLAGVVDPAAVDPAEPGGGTHVEAAFIRSPDRLTRFQQEVMGEWSDRPGGVLPPEPPEPPEVDPPPDMRTFSHPADAVASRWPGFAAALARHRELARTRQAEWVRAGDWVSLNLDTRQFRRAEAPADGLPRHVPNEAGQMVLLGRVATADVVTINGAAHEQIVVDTGAERQGGLRPRPGCRDAPFRPPCCVHGCGLARVADAMFCRPHTDGQAAGGPSHAHIAVVRTAAAVVSRALVAVPARRVGFGGVAPPPDPVRAALAEFADDAAAWAYRAEERVRRQQQVERDRAQAEARRQERVAAEQSRIAQERQRERAELRRLVGLYPDDAADALRETGRAVGAADPGQAAGKERRLDL